MRLLLQNLECAQRKQQGMTNVRANRPPPKCLPEAGHHETHTPQSLNVWVLSGRTREKSANPPDIACEIEQNTDVRNVFPVQNTWGLSLSRCVSHRCEYAEGAVKARICIPRLLTLRLQCVFWVMDLNLNLAFVCVCEKLVGG